MDFEINNIQYKKKITISELSTLQLDRPELQRDLSQETIQQIIDFQKNHYEKKGSFLFIGDLQIAISIDNNQMYLIDGQHRYYAILRELSDIMPDYIISLNFIKIQNSNNAIVEYPTLEDAFILINKYTPIPRYILDCLEQEYSSNYRKIIDHFRTYVKREYKPYISEAKKPRDPNINLDKMSNKIMDDSIILFQFIKDGQELFQYMKYINKNIWAAFDVEKKGEKVAGKPFHGFVQYMLTTKENNWTSSVLLLNRFKSEADKSPPPPPPTAAAANNRKGIPQKVKYDLWENYFGKNYNDQTCPVCEQTKISIIHFEAGHIIAAANGGDDTLDNLRPICEKCNRSMGTEHMDLYKEKYYPKRKK